MSAARDAGADEGTALGEATVAVIGLGLVGGSLARALAAAGARVLGSSPDAADRRGAEREGLRASADAAEVVGQADVVVYAAPLGAILEMLPAHAPLLRPHALVTDVAGLKRPVLAAGARAGLAGRLVGGHPMAGGEGSGFDGGRADLFQGARVYLCADPAVDAARRARAESLWRAVGAHPEWLDAAEHDRRMVEVSHLPQLVANALALALEAQGVAAADLGPGGRDMTRLAASPPGTWSDLLAHTGADAAARLRAVAERIEALAAELERGDAEAIAERMRRTRAWRSAGRERGEERSR